MANYEVYTASDGARLTYQSHGQPSPHVLILLHGFTGSSAYFNRNFARLSQTYWIIAPDHRGHGASAQTPHGHHVPRLAKDLHDLLAHLRRLEPACRPVGIGCSLGAAILWAYAELFDSRDFAGLVFVDQAPLQDYAPRDGWDAGFANYGCHDAASLADAQEALIDTPDTFYRGLVESCLAYRYKPDEAAAPASEVVEADEAFFVDISRQGRPDWFAKLLGNHTAYDHRGTLANVVDTPCCVIAGRWSGCFPLPGMLAAADLVNARRPGLATSVVVESGHCMSTKCGLGRDATLTCLQGCFTSSRMCGMT